MNLQSIANTFYAIFTTAAKILLSLPAIIRAMLASFAPYVVRRFLFTRSIFKLISDGLNDLVIIIYDAVIGSPPPGVQRTPKVLPALLKSPRLLVGLPFLIGSIVTILFTMASVVGIGITTIVGIGSIAGLAGILGGSVFGWGILRTANRNLSKTILPIQTVSFLWSTCLIAIVGISGSLLTSIPGSLSFTVLALVVLAGLTLVSSGLTVIVGMIFPYVIRTFYDTTIKPALSLITNIASHPIDTASKLSTWIIAGIILLFIPPINLAGIPAVLAYLVISPLFLVNIGYRWFAPSIGLLAYLTVATSLVSISLCLLSIDTIVGIITVCLGWLYPVLWVCLGSVLTIGLSVGLNLIRNVRSAIYKTLIYLPVLIFPLLPFTFPAVCLGIGLTLKRFATGICMSILSGLVALGSSCLTCLSLPPLCLNITADIPVIFFTSTFVFLMLVISQSVPSNLLFGETEALVVEIWHTALGVLADAYKVLVKLAGIPTIVLSFTKNPVRSVDLIIKTVGSTLDFVSNVVEMPFQMVIGRIR